MERGTEPGCVSCENTQMLPPPPPPTHTREQKSLMEHGPANGVFVPCRGTLVNSVAGSALGKFKEDGYC